MTVNTQENKTENVAQQDKVETNLPQQKVEANPNTQQVSQSQDNKVTESTEDPNWKAFREARKRDRAEREAAEKKAIEKQAEVEALKAAMEAAFSKSNPISPQQQYYPDANQYQQEETEEDRIKRMVDHQIAIREQAAEKSRLEREQREYPQRLMQTYSDFNHVTSQENLDYLDYHFPEVSRPLQRLNEGFDKWSDIYKAVKKFVPNHGNAKKDAAKAEANQNKPKSISSTGVTQTGDSKQSYMDVEKRRAERYEQMKKIINQVG